MDIIFWIVFGAIIGWISSILSDTKHPHHGRRSVIIGAVSALIGGWAVYVISKDQFETLNVYAIVGAVVFASLVLWVRQTKK
jgi:uncharacterized membrane protein YeaQ/YmgE (transglycosylase-associated protein family)